MKMKKINKSKLKKIIVKIKKKKRFPTYFKVLLILFCNEANICYKL